MLNRRDRISLKRNRKAVSWLTLYSLIITISFIVTYRNNSIVSDDLTIVSSEYSDYRKSIINKDRKMDSLLNNISDLKYQIDSLKSNKARPSKKLIFKPDTNIVSKNDSISR